MSALISAYDNPAGEVNASTAQEALGGVTLLAAAIGGAGLKDVVTGVLGDSTRGVGAEPEQREEGLRTREQDLEILGNGYLEIVRVCDGWGGDEDAGSMGLTLTFSPDSEFGVAIDPLIWGAFSNCRYRFGEPGAQVLLPAGAGLNVHHGGALSFGGLGQGALLVQITGEVEIDGEVVGQNLDFRVGLGSESFEIRVPTSGGDLVSVGSLGAPGVLRGSNGTWTCDVVGGTCTSDDTGDSFSLR
jgi:hypothetical protein